MCISGLKGPQKATPQGHGLQGHKQVEQLPAASLGAVLQGHRKNSYALHLSR